MPIKVPKNEIKNINKEKNKENIEETTRIIKKKENLRNEYNNNKIDNKNKMNKHRKKKKQHYFSEKPTSNLNFKKIFDSVRGIPLNLQTAGGTFSPEGIDKGTKLLIETITLPQKGPILDLGSGYGPISIWLEKYYQFQNRFIDDQKNIPEIYAAEINERAIWLLNRNIRDNNCKHIHILKGNFKESVSELIENNIKFGAIFSNPPVRIGHKAMLELMILALNLLRKDGFIQYVHKKKLGAAGFLSKLQEKFPDWTFQIIKKRGGYHIIMGSPTPFEIQEQSNDDWFS